MGNLNYFNLVKEKEESKENDLTRAYLALLRLSSGALAQFLNVVNDKLFPKSHLPAINILESQPCSIQTQTKRIKQKTGTVLSVLIRNSGPEISNKVQWSNREAIYDGIICFDPGLIFIIEAKLDDIGLSSQLDPATSSFSLESQQGCDYSRDTDGGRLNPNPDLLELYPSPIVLEWRDIIGGLVNSVDATSLNLTPPKRVANPLAKSELVLFEDFLDFVNNNHPKLGPYTNLKVCGNYPERIDKRCIAILREVSGAISPNFIASNKLDPDQFDNIPLAKNSAKCLWLDKDEDNIRLSVYPGDTVNQAKNLFSQTNLNVFQTLIKNNWTVFPNLHFSFVSKGLVHCNAEEVQLEKYWEYWTENQKDIRQWRREEWPVLIKDIKELEFMDVTDIANFDKNFTNTRRPTVNVCPGLGIAFFWPLNRAADLDRRGQFSQEVKTKAEEVLKVLV